MNELKVTQQAGAITTNLDSIEADLKELLKEYKDYVVSEDTIKDDKKKLSDLRKLQKSLDDARKGVKKAWLEPYEKFEQRCKQVIALVDEPINLINNQLKLFDEERVAQKREHIKEIYAEQIQGLERFLPLDKIYNPKWDNVSYDDKTIIFDINEMVLKVKNDLIAIHALNSEIEEQCIDTYANFGNDLSMAIQRNSQYLSDKQKVVEQVKEQPAVAKEKIVAQLSQSDKVHFIVSIEDAEEVENLLNLGGITFEKE